MEQNVNSETDILRIIESENSETTKAIKNVWTGGSLLGLAVLTINTYKDKDIPIFSIVIAAIIIILSINSLNFYNKIIVKIRDSKTGNRLSKVLVYSYLFLLSAIILKPLLSWLAIGLLIITIKAAHLFFFSKKKNFVFKIIKYFRNITIAYTIITLFAIVCSIYYDSGKISTFFDVPSNSLYQNIYNELNSLESKGIDTKVIKENIKLLIEDTIYKNRFNQYSYGFLLLFIVLSLIFFIIRMYKSMKYNELYGELRNFYKE